MNEQIFTIKGLMAYQSERQSNGNIIIDRAVLQSNGTFYKYCFYKGEKIGTPVRSKKDQRNILEFVESVKLSLK